ncbi:hypothetical protein CsatB_029110 [Cannabis sativa]|uniref:UTP23 sensor motif region domain-containing protein n=1 Tax=Cannabis sativa TaxID=3483 RepID=A0A7J6GPW4_CANSA|nr:uncharacterized protein LOC115720579 [Cannabis sativa]XP_060966251.1 uncharacterized protein LOC115720579 [Cannabis sativa]XP_060966252.1 uncharacterized protein LOC115720579 [Cannabis sativa]XP_060966253.1 uncharacterized protein LOC115720579 [Cannabis sativa]KAF4384410.1 hypothetical protein G4B88_028484 [Cannabis sativa]
MRIKKRKRQNRAVKFYTACCGFRKPFRVFCCGTFVHHLVDNHITPADQVISELLGSPVKLFTTRCIIEELKRLGPSYTEALEAARSLITARCPHEELKGGDACIADIIGKTNAEHFFLATTDYGLREKFREIPNTPIIYASRNAVLLESPSPFQRSYIKKLEEERSHMSSLELKILANKGISKEETEDEQTVRRKNVHKGLEMKDKVQFKRNRAKGPNPLSCLKKKKPDNADTQQKKDGNGNSDSSKKRNRKRKRSKTNQKKEASEN